MMYAYVDGTLQTSTYEGKVQASRNSSLKEFPITLKSHNFLLLYFMFSVQGTVQCLQLVIMESTDGRNIIWFRSQNSSFNAIF